MSALWLLRLVTITITITATSITIRITATSTTIISITTSISIIATNHNNCHDDNHPHQGEYGEKGIGSFIQLATKSGICIGVSITINRNAANQEFLKVIFSSIKYAFSSTPNCDSQFWGLSRVASHMTQ